MNYIYQASQDRILRLVFKHKQSKIWFAFILMILLMMIVFATKVSATEVQRDETDLHRLWERNCLICHGHAAEFSRTFLKIVDGQLQGPLYKENFRLFLNNHYLAGKEVDSIYSMLFAQNSSEPRFKQECSGCHKRAAEFVRESFILIKDVLYSKTLDTPIRDFLASHRGLNQEDVEFYMKQLNRLGREIHQK